MIQALLVLVVAFLFASIVIAIVTAIALALAAVAALTVLCYVVSWLCHGGQRVRQRHQARRIARDAAPLQARLRASQRVAALEHEFDMTPHLDPEVQAACPTCGRADLRTRWHRSSRAWETTR